ncbi:MAG: hypothetical protein KI790_19995, partial [Cyclobacteriaceae bacterium]|nr:hypothetical protein [Cyclobacteriaceae bacterium HetDA_MAG_MS6]
YSALRFDVTYQYRNELFWRGHYQTSLRQPQEGEVSLRVKMITLIGRCLPNCFYQDQAKMDLDKQDRIPLGTS